MVRSVVCCHKHFKTFKCLLAFNEYFLKAILTDFEKKVCYALYTNLKDGMFFVEKDCPFTNGIYWFVKILN